LANSSANAELSFVIPALTLQGGSSFSFSVRMVNFCGGTSSKSETVTLRSKEIPSLTLSPATQVTRDRPLVISATVTNQCPEEAEIDTFVWSTSDTELSPALFETAAATLIIPPNTLSLGKTYEFFLTYNFTDPDLADQRTTISRQVFVPRRVQFFSFRRRKRRRRRRRRRRKQC